MTLPPSRLAAASSSDCRQPLMSAPTSVPWVARPSEATAFARSAYITEIIFFMLCAIATVVSSALVKILPPQRGVLLVPYAGCLSGDRGRVSARGPGRSSFRGQMESLRSGADEECPWGGRWRISSRGRGRSSIRGTMKGVLSGASAGSPFGEARQALCPGTDAGCPFGSLSRVFSRGPMRGLRPGADGGRPSGCRCHRTS